MVNGIKPGSVLMFILSALMNRILIALKMVETLVIQN